ncbi:hypothetical protein AC233_00305 [Burkholderia sp. HB1]|nr:hypothetical protein AC233_00305 [Burkholderia sp. HB1]
MGLSPDEFLNTMERLQSRRIAVCVNDYILVRTWFRHNSWEATFTGNVAKAAAKEIASLSEELREHWVLALLEVGVPEETVRSLIPGSDMTRQEAGASHHETPLEGAFEPSGRVSATPFNGHANYNNNVNNNETKNTTPTSLVFDTSIEPHRKMLLRLLSGIDGDIAQTILDELVGALESIRSGAGRKPIGSVRAWVSELVKLAESGNFVPELAPAIRKKREQADAGVGGIPTAREMGRKNMDAVRAALASANTSRRSSREGKS